MTFTVAMVLFILTSTRENVFIIAVVLFILASTREYDFRPRNGVIHSHKHP